MGERAVAEQFCNPEFARLVAETLARMYGEQVAEGLRHLADQISKPRLPPKKTEAAPRSEKPWGDPDPKTPGEILSEEQIRDRARERVKEIRQQRRRG